MDPFHLRLARTALSASSRFGFALAGGNAHLLHGFGSRETDDVDLFTPILGGPADATRLVVSALGSQGLKVVAEVTGDAFAQLRVTDEELRESAKVKLCVEWRLVPPVVLDVGPVLDEPDVVAGKMCALTERHMACDFIDVDHILRTGRLTRIELAHFALQRDPGFALASLADSFSALRFMPDALFAAYGLEHADISILRARFAEWRRSIIESLPPAGS